MNKDIESIRNEFHRSEEARYIHRLHGVLLVLTGLSTVKAGKLLGDPQRTIAYWVIQFKKHGLDGLREAEKSGRPETLNPVQKKALLDALAKSPRDAGLDGDKWTNTLVSSLLAKRYGIALTIRHCTRLLRAFKDGQKT
jgi:transposase